MMHRAWSRMRHIIFKIICQISRSQGTKNHRFWHEVGISELQLQFEFTNVYEMMRKAWNRIEGVPYCFSKSSVKFQGHTGQKNTFLYPNWAFPGCKSSLNPPMVTKWYTKLEVAWRVPYCFSMSSVKFHGHMGQKLADFDLNWVFSDCNASFDSLMAIGWCKKLEVA